MRRALSVFGFVSALAVGGGAAWAQGDLVQQGAVVYSTHCVACHQATGQGVEGAFPGFVGSAFVLGDPAAVALLPLKGRGGMPNFGGELSDEEIAAVVSYIRNAWGNEASTLDAATVARLRSGETEVAPTDPNVRPGASN